MLIDLIVAGILLAQAVRGFRVGFGAFALSLVGMGLGAFLALRFAPGLIARVPELAASALATSVTLAVVLVVLALVGDALLGGLGRRFRAGTKNQGVRVVDGVLGAAIGVAVAALVVSIASTALAPVLPKSAAKAINSSTLLPALDRALPKAVDQWSSGLTALLDASGFPQVFGDGEPTIPGGTADPSIARQPEVRAAADSVLKINASALACGRAAEGSGWVAAPQRVVTNAHVVAGASAVSVREPGTGRVLDARVVSYDPRLDLAILAVPDLTAPALRRAGEQPTGTNAVVAGYPLDGPYRLDAARITAKLPALGADIYGRPGVNREIYAISGTVQPGNSGGPLLTADGRVAGTVFARSTANPGVGFVLTNAATKALVDAAARDTTTASTQGCVPD